MIKKQQLRIYYIEEISIKNDAKNIKYYEISKSYCKFSANSLAMLTKEQIRINYIKEITIKCEAKNMKYYHI